MISISVTSLFASISSQIALGCIYHIVEKNPSLPDRTAISTGNIISLVVLCIYNLVEQRTSKCKEYLRLPQSELLPNAAMEQFEAYLWVWYMNDMFLAF